MAILSILLTVIIIATSILLVLIVLVQRPKQEGLGAAFGGGTLDSALGAHTTDVLQKMTTYLGIIFFVSAIGLAMVKARQFRSSAANDVLEKVENREPALPDLPPSVSGLPGVDQPQFDFPDPAQKGEAPSPEAPAPEAETPAPDAEAPAPAAPKAESPAPAAPKAEGGKAKAPAKAKSETPAPDAPKVDGGKAKEAPKADAPSEN